MLVGHHDFGGWRVASGRNVSGGLESYEWKQIHRVRLSGVLAVMNLEYHLSSSCRFVSPSVGDGAVVSHGLDSNGFSSAHKLNVLK